ncbi:MAG: hypothetical protein GXO87_13310 [Chlorobi bacterium]|nr:hypothetical protein [Chlorobiota bacterium]
MEKKEKIFELLSKENLTSEETRLLNKLIEENPEFKRYLPLMQTLKSLPEKTHIDADVIAEYVMFKNGMTVDNSSIIEFAPRVEKHLSSCEKCMNVFTELNEEFNEVDNYVTEQFAPKEEKAVIHEKTKGNVFEIIWNFFNAGGIKYSLATAFSALLIYVTLFGISEITTPNYIGLFGKETIDEAQFTRGRETPFFLKGQTALNDNDIDSAIKYFKEDLKRNPNDNTDFYTNYILGMLYLKKSKTSFIGLFPSFNEDDLSGAINNFKTAIKKNKTGMFENINYNAYYFLGEAYLLKNDFQNAIKYLNLVVENRGGYSEEAKKMLSELKG